MGAAITISSHANGGEVDIFEYLAGVSRDRSRPIVVAERLAGSAGRAGRAALAHTHISYTHTASTRNHECTHSTRLLLFPLKTSAQWHEFGRRDWRRLRLRRPASLALVSLIPNTNGLVRGRLVSLTIEQGRDRFPTSWYRLAVAAETGLAGNFWEIFRLLRSPKN